MIIDSEKEDIYFGDMMMKNSVKKNQSEDMKTEIPSENINARTMEVIYPERQQICIELQKLADEEYRRFHSRLCPGTEGILGVRTPKLRKYAGEIVNRYGQQVINKDWYTLQYVRSCKLSAKESVNCPVPDFYYEEKLLTGILLGMWKAPDPQDMEQMLEYFLPLIDNWAVCDLTCGGLKYIKKHREYFYPVLQKYLKSTQTWTVRFGIVLLMNYYTDDKYFHDLLLLYEQIHHEDYYVKMAVAWAYSILLVKFFEPTFLFLENCSLDFMTFQKTVQKACESRRISDEQKKRLRRLKDSRKGLK